MAVEPLAHEYTTHVLTHNYQLEVEAAAVLHHLAAPRRSAPAPLNTFPSIRYATILILSKFGSGNELVLACVRERESYM